MKRFLESFLVDLEKRCKMSIHLQRSVPIQPKTSEILPEILPKIGFVTGWKPSPARGSRGRRGGPSRREGGRLGAAARERGRLLVVDGFFFQIHGGFFAKIDGGFFRI